MSANRLPTADRFSWPQLLALHLGPGVLITVAFVALAPVVEAARFPPIAALLLAIALVLVPVELGIVLRAGGRLGSPLAAVPYRRPMPLRDWLWLVPALIVAEFAGFGILALIEPGLISGVFGWLPEWFVRPLPVDHVANYSSAAWVITLGAYFVLNGFVGPIVEELYFRGYLLPRMERLGNRAPLVNVTLFSMYHFWSPWQVLARIAALVPTAYAVRWKQNVYLGMVVHCTGNTLGIVLVSALILGRV